MYFIEKSKDFNLTKRFDYMLFSAVLILSLIGIFVVNSATLSYSDSGQKIMTTQVIGLVAGIILCIIISVLDYKDFKNLGIILYIISIVLLAAVLVFGTGDYLGSRSWLKFGIFSFQPSEIAKISFILIISIFLERIKEKDKDKTMNIIKLAVYSIIPVALVVAQHDYGTAMVFLFIFLVMLFTCGINYKYILVSLGTLILSAPLLWYFVLNDRRRDRIRVFLDPELDPLGSGYNVLRAKMAIGSGQVFGKGLFKGIQTQNSYVPVKESDFIFSVIGEELGFIGCLIILSLIFFVLLRCVYIAKNSSDTFGAFLTIGITAMFGAHFIENIGMNIGLLPVTGIPLSFVSAGGSALVTSFIAIGIVLSISLRRKRELFEPNC